MPDTIRSLSDILALFADNTSGDISAQDLRDFVLSSASKWGVGYISRSAVLEYVSTTSVRLAAGSAMVNGSLLTWGSPITWSGSAGSAPLDAAQVVYAYLYDSGGGTAALEISTTAPAWDSGNDCWSKTGDTTRRFVGYFRALLDTTYKIANWISVVSADGRTLDVMLLNDLAIAPRPVSGGTASTWTSFSVAEYVPTNALAAAISIKPLAATAGDDVSVGVDAASLGTAIATFSPYCVRFNTYKTNGVLFPGFLWVPLQTSQTLYYRVTNHTGTGGAAYIDVFGARFFR